MIKINKNGYQQILYSHTWWSKLGTMARHHPVDYENPWYLGCDEGGDSYASTKSHKRSAGKTIPTGCECHQSWVGYLCHHKSRLEQEECSRSRSNPGHSIKCDTAKIPITRYCKRGTWCPGDRIWSSGGGAWTYLQLVNMVKLQFTDSMDLLPQIQGFQDNYNMIMSNGHSRLSKDLATFLFCSSLLDSYELTARQYLDNIMSIANYKISDIITWVLHEENRWKAMALRQGSSLNKFSTMKNIGKKCAKCGKTNHTMQNHWPGGKNPNKKGKGQQKSKRSDSSGKKKMVKKGKGKEKAPASANVLTVLDLANLSIQMAQSIDFSCYKTSEKVEWCLDSGCTDHISPSKSDFVQYRELIQASKAEIADGKYLKIEGYGTVIGYSIMPNKTVSLQIQNMLYIPEANKWLFLLIAARQWGSMSQTTSKGTMISLNGKP